MSSKSDIAVSVGGLSKCYAIAQNKERHTTAAEALMHRLRNPFAKPQTDTFWALKDVSFDIHKGDVVGVIGRNGAGKSTLLKILSRITEPTAGRIKLYGRVGSLLEVGTGFHPELTGRENIYLNGAILGMTRQEITRQFDAIVDFSGTEPFLDTPVKRYSSGMYVRLAFAVAAHLNPEILIVDEVLAVGDAEFQKKCLGKMKDVANAGRTVLFVSHNMAAVISLCSRAIMLKSGTVTMDCDPKRCVSEYMSIDNNISQKSWSDPLNKPGDDLIRLSAVRVVDEDGVAQASFRSSQSAMVELEFHLYDLHPSLCIGFDLFTIEGVCVFRSFHTDMEDSERPLLCRGFNTLRSLIPNDLLNAGIYTVAVRIGIHHVKWIVVEDSAIQFEVLMDHGMSSFLKSGSRPGPFAPMLKWERAE